MKNLDFSSQERSAILWLAATFTILLIFWELFREEITTAIIIQHAVFFFATMLVAIFLHEIGHKIAAEYVGYTAEAKRFTGGLIASTIIAFYTFARIPIITPNLLELDADPRRRLDKRRMYDNPSQQAIIAGAGILGSIVAITLMRVLAELTGYTLFSTAQFGVSLHAVFSLVPFELLAFFKLRVTKDIGQLAPSDGLHIFRYSQFAWIFAFVFAIVFSIISFIQGVPTLLFSLAIATIGVLVYKNLVKK